MEQKRLGRHDEERREQNRERTAFQMAKAETHARADNPAVETAKDKEHADQITEVFQPEHHKRVQQHQCGGGAKARIVGAIDRDLALHERLHRALTVAERELHILEAMLAELDHVVGHAVGGIGEERRGVDQRQPLGREPRKVGVLADRLGVFRAAKKLRELYPVEAPTKRKQIEIERLEIAEVALRVGLIGEAADLALERWRQMFTLIKQRGEQDDRVERLAAGLDGRHEPPGRRNIVRAEKSLHAKRARIGKIGAQRLTGLARNEKCHHRRALGVPCIVMQFEQRIEEGIPTTPRDHVGLLGGEVLQSLFQLPRTGILNYTRGVENERGRPDLLGIDELPAESGERWRAHTRLAQ